MSNALTTLTTSLAKRFDLGDGSGLMDTLKATAFKGQVSDAQMTALLIVANQYGLNPWTKEIYAFPDKNNGIVPVVGVDGWARIINEHPQFDGEEFEYGPTIQHKNKTANEWIECVIYRKDRSKPTRIREFFDEVNQDGKIPWQSHPKRMHRHKALIQCARLAFGFGGIYDQDEAERIAEIEINPVPQRTAAAESKQIEALPAYPDAEFSKNLTAWGEAITAGKAKPEQIVSRSSTRYTLSAEQIEAIYNLAKPQHIDGDGVIDADFVREFEGAGK